MPLLRVPEPYDFELSTERFRVFGSDLANLWQDGALHRVVGRREVRVEAARGRVGVAATRLDYAALATLPDEEVKATLTSVRGLGEWTADWFLARHLARPSAWPAGDLGLRKAVAAFYPEAGDVRAFGARFEPFQNLAAHYLLTGLRWQRR